MGQGSSRGLPLLSTDLPYSFLKLCNQLPLMNEYSTDPSEALPVLPTPFLSTPHMVVSVSSSHGPSRTRRNHTVATH